MKTDKLNNKNYKTTFSTKDFLTKKNNNSLLTNNKHSKQENIEEKNNKSINKDNKLNNKKKMFKSTNASKTNKEHTNVNLVNKKQIQPQKEQPNFQDEWEKIKKKKQNTRTFTFQFQNKVKIIPLGGLDQIGMNMTVIETDTDIIVIDCGLAFPDDTLLGIDFVIPDVKYLVDNIKKVRAFVITHGHEDHIGAIPYILKDVNVPIYATKLTLELIKHKLDEVGLLQKASLNCVSFGETIKLGESSVEFIKTNHSIVDACAIAIYTKAGILMHTGDFKVDYTPVFGDAIDLKRFAEIGSKGVLALMSDSTNALKPGFTMSEKTVGETFDLLFGEYTHNRIIVSTFASNVDRVRQIIDTASRYGRKVDIEGRSMVNIIKTAEEIGYLTIPEGTIIDSDQLQNYPDEKTVIITTGSQGESMAALSRMVFANHKQIEIKPTDVVILSSTPIPGNEKSVNRIINELSKKQARVIYQDTHVSGHACEEELKLIYTLVQPEYAIPVHGEYRHRMQASHIACEVGVEKKKCLLIENGDVLELGHNFAKVIAKVSSGGVNVDGLGVGDVGSIVLKDRQVLGNDGIIIVIIVFDSKTSEIVAGPEIISRGFVYMNQSEKLVETLKEEVIDVMEACKNKKTNDWSAIKRNIKATLTTAVKKKLKREPFILPIIMEV